MRRFESQRIVFLGYVMLAVTLVLLGRVEPAAAAACDAATKVWDGGGGTDSWTAPANWSPDGLPTSTDDVCISGASVSIPASTSTAARTFQIASAASLTVSSGAQLAVAGPAGSSVDAGASLSVAGTLAGGAGGTSPLTVDGSLALSGTSTITLPIVVAASGTITRTSPGTTVLSGAVTNSGSISVAAGTLRLAGAGNTSSGSLQIDAGAVLTNMGGSTTYGPSASITGAGDFLVAGATVTLSAGATYGLDAFTISTGTLTLNGPFMIPTVTLSGGAINGTGDLTVTSTLAMAANSTMGGSTAASTTVASGATATLSVPSGILTLGRTLSIASGATATFDGNGTISGGGGGTGVISNAGVLLISGNSTITVAVINQASGAITKSSSGTTTFSGATTNNGDLTVAAGTLSLAGTFTSYNQATDVLAGGAYHLRGTLRFIGADIVTNQAAIVLDGAASAIVDTSGNDGFRDLTTNAGSLTVTGGRTLTLPKALTSTGALTIGPASTLAAPSVTLNGGTLSGHGTVAAPVTNGGTVLPGTGTGILTVTGSYTQTATGDLGIEIGGDTPGTGHDQLNITGPAALDGTLNLSATVGFEPSIGQTFTILTYASHTGCFATINGRDLADVGQGMFFDVSCGPTSAVITTRRAEISIDDASIAEGNGGQQAMTFTVSQNVARSDLATSVDFATADGSATSPADYAAGSGTLTFTAGDVVLTRVIAVDVEGDLLDEFDEQFAVELSNASNAFIAFGSGSGTIVDDDLPPTVTVEDAAVTEGNSGTTALAFNVALSAPSAVSVTVDYDTVDGTASAPTDYAAASGTLTFAPGESAKPLVVEVNGDALDEPNEAFVVDLSNPSNATIGDGSGTGTIADDDPAPTVRIDDQAAVEGDTGTTAMTFTVVLSAASGRSVTVDYATANGTATAPADYAAASGTLTFAPGETSKQLTVAVQGDTLDESNETFSVNLSNPSAVVIADGSGVGTITDDDPKPTITSVSPSSVPQGATVTIRGSNLTGATQVAFARAGGGTVNAATFRVVNDSRVTATVPAGATTGRVTVTTVNGVATSPSDLLIEPKIGQFSPTSGPVGTVVTITGSGFTGVTTVRFGGTAAVAFTANSDAQITATVPAGAGSGKITVVTPGGSDTSMGKFTVR